MGSHPQIVEGWQARGATIGIYDYFSVIAWDWNQPRAAKAARPAELAAAIRRYHRQGARFLDAESGDAWGPYGLGYYYVAARVMWDIDQADHVKEIVDDFLTRAFGPAEAPMRTFYQLITEDRTPRSGTDVVGRLYRHLAAARTLAATRPDVLKRLDDLVLYTRYVELYNVFSAATGKAHEAAKLVLLRHAFRMRRTMMVHTYGLWARLASQKAANDPTHPARDEAPFSPAAINALMAGGIARNEPVEIEFQTVSFSDDLVPAAEPLRLAGAELSRGSCNNPPVSYVKG